MIGVIGTARQKVRSPPAHRALTGEHGYQGDRQRLHRLPAGIRARGAIGHGDCTPSWVTARRLGAASRSPDESPYQQASKGRISPCPVGNRRPTMRCTLRKPWTKRQVNLWSTHWTLWLAPQNALPRSVRLSLDEGNLQVSQVVDPLKTVRMESRSHYDRSGTQGLRRDKCSDDLHRGFSWATNLDQQDLACGGEDP